MQNNRLWRRRAPIAALASLAALVGLTAPASAQAPDRSSLSGYVYIDRNNDGALTFNDQPDPEFVIPGVTIQLWKIVGMSETLVEEQVTDGVGKYQFGGLDGGTFTLKQVQPAQYVSGQSTVGVIKDLMGNPNPPGADGGTALLNAISDIQLPDDSRGVLFNFAELGVAPGVVSKRYLLGTAPPLPTAEIPEPASFALVSIASLGALATLRRKVARS